MQKVSLKQLPDNICIRLFLTFDIFSIFAKSILLI